MELHATKKAKVKGNSDDSSLPVSSTLDTLPVELIQKIGILSRNVALLHVSKCLRSALLSPIVRERLVQDIVYDPDLRGTEHTVAHDQLCNLVMEGWFSLALLRKVITSVQISYAKDALIWFNEHVTKNRYEITLVDIAESCRDLEEVFRGTVTNSFSPYLETGLLREWYDAGGVLIFEVGANDEEGFLKIKIYSQQWTHGTIDVLGHVTGTKAPRALSNSNPLLTPLFPTSFVIPKALLRAPFTQRQGDILPFLIRSCFPITDRDEDLCLAASNGLMDALVDGCWPAVRTFTDTAHTVQCPVRLATASTERGSSEPWCFVDDNWGFNPYQCLTRLGLIQHRHIMLCVQQYEKHPAAYGKFLYASWYDRLRSLTKSTRIPPWHEYIYKDISNELLNAVFLWSRKAGSPDWADDMYHRMVKLPRKEYASEIADEQQGLPE